MLIIASIPTKASIKSHIIPDEARDPNIIDKSVNSFNIINDFLGFSIKYFKEDSPL